MWASALGTKTAKDARPGFLSVQTFLAFSSSLDSQKVMVRTLPRLWQDGCWRCSRSGAVGDEPSGAALTRLPGRHSADTAGGWPAARHGMCGEVGEARWGSVRSSVSGGEGRRSGVCKGNI